MKCTKTVDMHTDSGYRRITSEEDIRKGYGMKGLTVHRHGTSTKEGKPVVHLIESICKSHRLTVRSSYAAETLAAAHGLDDAYPTLITLHELRAGVLNPEE